MGLTREYLRYVASNTFGVITSNQSSLRFIELNKKTYIATGACEYVFIWDIKKSEIVSLNYLPL